ncbi:hypothetical protein KAI92_04030 [Candidatus Parcubacteria bacterium]|nr:hypothetical protein [Candidatus Parcubacteria bacterium]
MTNKKLLKIFSISGFCFLLIIGIYFIPKIALEARWNILAKQAKASGGGAYQIGLIGTTQIQCIQSCCTPTCTCCAGGTLCITKDVATCAMYSEISGMQAGGMGTMALFSQTATGMAGYKMGDDIIAAGMSMTQMDNGVLATPGGCSGCIGKLDTSEKFVMWLSDFFIAGRKN